MKKYVAFGVLSVFTSLAFAGTSQSELIPCFEVNALKSNIETMQCKQADTNQLAHGLEYSAQDNRFVNAICNSLNLSERAQCKNPQAAFSYFIEATGLANIIKLGSEASQDQCNMFNEDKATIQYILTRYSSRHHC